MKRNRLLLFAVLLVTLIILMMTKELYLAFFNEWLIIGGACVLLSLFFKRKILWAFFFYLSLTLFDIIFDFQIALRRHEQTPLEERDGGMVPFGEVWEESYDEYMFLNLLLPVVAGLLATLFSKLRRSAL